MDAFSLLSGAANSGAFGVNGTPTPTLAQVRGGNYCKGRLKLHGLRIAIETPQGSRRTGKSDGQPWSVICQAHYGYIEGTKGADGDELDVFVGPWPEAEMAYVVSQAKGDDSGFDEHKILLGFTDIDSAVLAYRNSYQQPRPTELSVIACSIEQLKWWIKHGNHAVPLLKNQLPYDGTAIMNETTWDSGANPVGISLPNLMYAMRSADRGENLLLDAVTVRDVLEDSDGEIVLDGMLVPFNLLERKLGQMQVIMRAAGSDVKPLALQVTPPFKQRGTTNVAGIFEMSDGQTITVFFHNPDSTPNKLTPTDEMVSWKWMLNKKDVTIVVAREQGRELNPREVARRIMRLVQANSTRFQSANAKRAERLAGIDASKSAIEGKQAQLDELNTEIETLEQRVEEKRKAPPAVLEKNDQDDLKNSSGEVGPSTLAPYSDQHQLLVALLALGWSKQSEPAVQVTGGNPELYWVTRTIGGGAVTTVNPQGARRLAAKLNDGQMQATHGSKVLASAPFNQAASFDDNAKVLNDAVDAIDPAKPKPVAETASVPDFIAAGFTQVQSNDYAKRVQAGEHGLNFNIRVTDDGFRVSMTIQFPGGITGGKVEMGNARSPADALGLIERETARRIDLYAPEAPSKSDAERALELIREAKGGVAKLGGSSFFTFDVDGDEAIFDDDMRAKVEELLGEKVKEVVLPGLEGQVSIVPASFNAETGAQDLIADGALAALEAAGWSRSDGSAIATKTFKSLDITKDALAFLTGGDGHNRTLQFEFVSEGRNVAESSGVLIPVGSSAEQAQAIATKGIAAAEKKIGDSYGARLATPDPLAEARAYLATVIDGSIDLADPAVADRLTDLYEAHNGNAEFDELFGKAADAYQAFMVSAAQAALSA